MYKIDGLMCGVCIYYCRGCNIVMRGCSVYIEVIECRNIKLIFCIWFIFSDMCYLGYNYMFKFVLINVYDDERI